MRHELSNKWAGQFFTPMSVSRTVARLTIGDGSIFREKPFVTVQEPACGSGGMVLAFAHEAVAIVPDLVVPEQLHVNAIDVSPVCVHMAMIQLSLSGIAAVICRGNSLSLKMEETWLSPSHVFGGWSKKLDQARGSL
jgi:type I restriction-modification system DNA methylase subunit